MRQEADEGDFTFAGDHVVDDAGLETLRRVAGRVGAAENDLNPRVDLLESARLGDGVGEFAGHASDSRHPDVAASDVVIHIIGRHALQHEVQDTGLMPVLAQVGREVDIVQRHIVDIGIGLGPRPDESDMHFGAERRIPLSWNRRPKQYIARISSDPSRKSTQRR